jgi:bifunctional ADP-heptose synthase (sugar kinase/adenylyltransferase)
MEKTRARRMLVTLGKEGLVAFDRASQDPASRDFCARLRSEQLPALAEHAVDRLGCGDALLAVATLAMAAGAGFMQAAYLGSVAAALEVMRMGNVPIHGVDFRRFVMALDAESESDFEWAPELQAAPGGVRSIRRVPPRLETQEIPSAMATRP